MDPNLVILAGGISSRMRKSVAMQKSIESSLIADLQKKPKSMIGVGGKGRPLMDYLLYNAREAGYRDVMIVVGENDEYIRQWYGSSDRGNRFHGIDIGYAVQTIPEDRNKPLGTADALLQALGTRSDWRGKKFTVCNSDNLYSQNAFRLLRDSSYPCALIDYDLQALEFDQTRIEQFAVIQKDSEGFLTQIIEKPSPQQLIAAADSTGRIGVSMNIFRFTYDLISPVLKKVPIHPVRLEKELPQAVMMIVANDAKAMMTIPLSEHVPDLTHQKDILQVQGYLNREYADFSWNDS
jgi:NDP-sugar pyrophosphorylase family protein